VNARYAGAILARMAERVAAAEERNLRSAMQRAEASGDSGLVLRLHADLVAVANYRRALADRARGDS
jgi:DNA primase